MTPLDALVRGAAGVFDGDALHRDAVVGIVDGAIVHVGPEPALEFAVTDATTLHDADGGLVTPGLVDPHTHLVFAGDRSAEYAERATGTSYLEIAARGGGIAFTTRATRAASLDELVDRARPRLDRLLSFGVTTAEVKSGYGLDTATELKMLEAVRRLNAEQPIALVPTFLGAHTTPPEYRGRRGEYVDVVVEEMLPAVAEAGLAEFCDVFVEEGAFSLAEAERVLRAGLEHGLKPKLHADQLSAGGGAELAGELAAVSADHLEHISDAGIRALAEAGTVAVLLPGAGVFLGEDARPPARRLIEAGVPVALATDCNPGTCMTENLQLMLTLGMSRLGMSPTEVLAGVTRHAAQAVGRSAVAGRLAPGRPADLCVFDAPDPARLAYHFGVNHARRVLVGGRIAWDRLSGTVM